MQVIFYNNYQETKLVEAHNMMSFLYIMQAQLETDFYFVFAYANII